MLAPVPPSLLHDPGLKNKIEASEAVPVNNLGLMRCITCQKGFKISYRQALNIYNGRRVEGSYIEVEKDTDTSSFGLFRL